MQRGDIVLVDLPVPTGPPGNEQFGSRPAVILQDNSVNLQSVVLVPLTSNLTAIRFAGTVRINRSQSNSLNSDSIALTGQIRAIDKHRVRREIIGTIDAGDLAAIELAVRKLLCL